MSTTYGWLPAVAYCGDPDVGYQLFTAQLVFGDDGLVASGWYTTAGYLAALRDGCLRRLGERGLGSEHVTRVEMFAELRGEEYVTPETLAEYLRLVAGQSTATTESSP